jgi:hypothetical protein
LTPDYQLGRAVSYLCAKVKGRPLSISGRRAVVTLASEELHESRLWKHRWTAFLVCLFVLALGGLVASLRVRPYALYIPLGLAEIISALVLLRLMQLYYAPKEMKSETAI